MSTNINQEHVQAPIQVPAQSSEDNQNQGLSPEAQASEAQVVSYKEQPSETQNASESQQSSPTSTGDNTSVALPVENKVVESFAQEVKKEENSLPIKEESSNGIASADEIIACARKFYPNIDADLIRKAYDFSSVAHAGQLRMSGEPYFIHPAAVAKNIASMGFDEHAIAAGLLHDAVEDTSASIEELDSEFGEQVADIVDGVTKISLMTFDTKEIAQAENIRKMILAMSHDIRVPIVKLADRTHNMRTLGFQKPHKKISISQETMDIYAPLANRLGLHKIKQELEDLSFRYLQPERYEDITHWLQENQVVERQIINKVIQRIEDIMKEHDIQGRVFGRLKQVYSIFLKMQEQGTSLDEMHDIIAFRVIVNDLKDCYAVLGLVHALWRPVAGRFKDYISLPKPNGYQSLHSTVIGPEGERIEIQIRTEEMNAFAEHGVASHWLYKEKNSSISSNDMPQFQWIRDILERQRDETDSKEFMQSLRLELFSNEIYIFTPRGEVKQLPEGATPIDFAFHIHTDIGFHCSGSKVNGRLVPLTTKLKSGDTVEIFTDKNRSPSRDWLKTVKTAKARNRIQSYLRVEERKAAITIGKDLLEKEGRRAGLNIIRATKDGTLAQIVPELSVASVDEIFASVGYAKITPTKVLEKLDALINPKEIIKEAFEEPTKPIKKEKQDGADSTGIVVQGLDDTLIHLAKCCKPVPGDNILGFISRGRGLIVHVSDCPHLLDLEPERFIPVTWKNEEPQPFPARIRIVGRNEKGFLAKITTLLCESDINIPELMATSSVDGRTEVDITVEISDAARLYQIIDQIDKLPMVISVTRDIGESSF